MSEHPIGSVRDGTYVERIVENDFNVLNFASAAGATASNLGDGRPALAAFDAAIAAIDSLAAANNLKRGRRLIVPFNPFGAYRMEGPLHITRAILLQGESGEGEFYGGTELLFDAGVHGLIIDRVTTTPDGGSGGDSSVIEHLTIRAAAKTVPDCHGMQMWGRSTIRHCLFKGWSGDGMRIDADHNQVPATNANKWFIEKTGSVNNNGYGLLVNGNDANAGKAHMVDCRGNGKWNFRDSSGLGNTYDSCHASGANNIVRQTTLTADITATATSIPVADTSLWVDTVLASVFGRPRGGALIIGAEKIRFADTSTTSGPGNLTGCVRGVENSGDVSGQGTAHLSGAVVDYKGGGYTNLGSSNSNRSLYTGNYGEGQGFTNIIQTPAIIVGGTMNNVGTGLYIGGGGGNGVTPNGFVFPLGYDQSTADGFLGVAANAEGWNALQLFRVLEGTYGLTHSGLASSRSTWNMVNTLTAFALTTAQDARGPGYMHMPTGFFLGAGNSSNGCLINTGGAAPTAGTWRKGDIVLNTNVAEGGPVGWVCVVAGTPGTWLGFGNVDQSVTGSIASASTVTLTVENVAKITGTATIDTITASTPGRRVTLVFTSTAGISTAGNVKLAGAFVAAANDTITLVCDGTNWWEAGRKMGGEVVVAHGNTGSTETFDVAAGTFHTATLDAACTFTFTAPPNSAQAFSMTIQLTKTAGTETVTWPASVKWPGGTAPTLTATAGAVDVLAFHTSTGGTSWRGVLAQADSR